MCVHYIVTVSVFALFQPQPVECFSSTMALSVAIVRRTAAEEVATAAWGLKAFVTVDQDTWAPAVATVLILCRSSLKKKAVKVRENLLLLTFSFLAEPYLNFLPLLLWSLPRHQQTTFAVVVVVVDDDDDDDDDDCFRLLVVCFLSVHIIGT